VRRRGTWLSTPEKNRFSTRGVTAHLSEKGVLEEEAVKEGKTWKNTTKKKRNWFGKQRIRHLIGKFSDVETIRLGRGELKEGS